MTGARVRIPPSPPRKRDRICGLFFVLHKRRRDEKGTTRLWREKNHPANGFLVPRAGGGTAPVPPGESLLLRQEKEIAFAVSFSCCIKEGGMRRERPACGGKKPSSEWFFSSPGWRRHCPSAAGRIPPSPPKSPTYFLWVIIIWRKVRFVRTVK